MNEKRLWRQRCREIRGVRAREAGPMLEEAFERCLEEVKTGTIGICWPFGSESDLRAAALRWCGDDSARRLAVPAVEETGIRYRLWEKDTPLTKDRAGLTVPDAEAVFPSDIPLRDTVSATEAGISTASSPRVVRRDAFSSPSRRRRCPRRSLRRTTSALTR